MAKYKCKMCGAPLDVSEGQTVITCDFCQSKQTVANANDERKENLFNRANFLRAACDFDKAILAYQSILSIFPSEPEAHWGLCLCKYGIEYVDDPSTHKKIPTIHRVSFDSILKDSDYLAALSYADAIAREEYQEEASQIANIQKNILSISQKEEPFDVFICYKETTETGKRTPDSVLAQEVYSNLTDRGYKVFFSRITLESKLGSMYEPYIFAALNSAKIMLVFGTRKEYFEAVWVKNEWSRFIDMMKTRPDHYLIPCYRDMDAYEMPEQFLSFQGQDMGKLGFMQDLIRGVDKIMGRSEAPKTQAETKIIQTDVNVPALLTRAEILIGDGNFEKADELLERVLDNDPKNSQAYLLKLLIELQLKTVDELKTLDDTIEGNSNFKKAYDFGDSQQKNKLSSINEFIINRNEETRLGRLYDIAMDYKNSGRYAEAEAAFSEIAGFRDANKQALDCVNLGKEDLYKKATLLKESKQYANAIETFEKIKDYKDSELQISQCRELSDKDKYERATELKERGMFDEASSLFMEILRYGDSDFQVDECARLKTEAKKETIYVTCLFDREINPYFDASALKKACEKLATIPGYKDADQLLVKYEGIIKDYETELAKKREIAAREKAKKMKKVKKISFFSAIGALGLTGVLLLTFLFLVPSGRQWNIQSLINQGEYDEAMALINHNGSFGDTENLKNMCYAGQAFERLDYETGIDYIYKIGGAVDVAYDSDGGNASINTETIKRTRGYIDNDSDKPGYDFHGWVLTGYDLDAKAHYASLNLKAEYQAITYSISFNLDGGTCSSLPSSYNTEESVSIPNPTKEGYTFLGWTGLDLPTATVDYVLPFGSTGNKSYTANWKANEYTIYLNANGGEVSSTEIKVTYDSNYKLPTPSYSHYDFNGWFDEKSIQYFGGVFKTPSNVYLTANWSAHNYLINYNLNGGTNNFSNPSNYTVESCEISLLDPSKTGYSFAGWTTNEISDPTKNLIIPAGSSGDKTFTANWIANTYRVSVDLNGGQSANTSYDIIFDSPYSLSIPTRTGYSFDKFTYGNDAIVPTSGVWSIAENITIKANWIADSNTPYLVNYYTENLDGYGYSKETTDIFTGTSDTTITIAAKNIDGFTPKVSSKSITIAADGTTVVDFYYSRNSYTLSFVTNGGNLISSEIYKYEQRIPSTLMPIRRGYTFAGWYTEEAQVNLFDKMPSSNQTVYAYYSEETKASCFTYSFSNHETTITKGINLNGKVVVPEYIAGKLVTKIGDNAFLNCTGITEMTLSSSVEELGASSFKGCSALYRINGTSNISTIKESTFEDCSSLAYFPDLSNVTSIGNKAFKGCTSLITFELSDNLTTIGSYAFQDCVLLLMTPDLSNVINIGSHAFDGCTLLSEIKSLNGCSSFGECVFAACENIAKITLSFRNNIEQLYLSSLFNKATSYDESKYYQVTGKNNAKYLIPNSLRSIEILDTEQIPAYLFYGLKSITSVQTGNMLSVIGEYSFYGCNLLKQIPGLSDCEYIGDYALCDCSSILEIDFTNAEYIGKNSLSGCSSISKLVLPFMGTELGSCEPIGVLFGNSSFEGSVKVTQETRSKTKNWTHSWEPGYFYGYSSANYYLPSSIKELTILNGFITRKSCTGLSSLKKLVVGSNIEYIEYAAFQGALAIEHLSLPFVGESSEALYEESVLGHIFGYETKMSAGINQNSFEACSWTRCYSGSTDKDLGYGLQGTHNSREFVDAYVSSRHYFENTTWQYSSYSYENPYQDNYSNYLVSYYYYIPNNLKVVEITAQNSIPQAAFNGCSNIEIITIPETVSSIGACAFSNCKNLMSLNSRTEGVLNIPLDVERIENSTFACCSLIEKVSMGNCISYIGDYAFTNCTLVSRFNSDIEGKMIIPDSCSYIGDYAFKGMGLIDTVVVGDDVASIGSGAFEGFNSLVDITIPFIGKTEEATGSEGYFGYIFGSQTNTNVPNTIRKVTATCQTDIPANAFYNCDLIDEIHLNVNATSIGPNAFYNCGALKRLNSNVDGVFNIPIGVFNIGDYSFYNCSSAMTVSLGNIVNIGNYAFANCNSVSKFNSNSSGSLVIPSDCESIGDYAFKGMGLIDTVVVGDDVASIGSGAFEGFNSLVDITIPFIGKTEEATGSEGYFGYIFGSQASTNSSNKCSTPASMSSGYSYITQDAGWYGTIYGVSGTWYTKYYVPSTIRKVTVTCQTGIPANAFYNCDLIDEIHLNVNATSIGPNVFYNCYAAVDNVATGSKSPVWNGTLAESYHSGSGTMSDPFIIFSAEEFAYFLSQIDSGANYYGAFFKLSSDINLGGNTIDSICSSSETAFKGSIDGCGHKVHNFSVQCLGYDSYVGLFGYFDGTLKNIGFEFNFSFISNKANDIFVGHLIGNLNGHIENVYSSGTLICSSIRAIHAGGLIGQNNGFIKNSYANVDIESISNNNKSYAGGLIGHNNGFVVGCFSYGNVSSTGYADSYSFVDRFVADEGSNSSINSCFSFEGQIIKKYGSVASTIADIVPCVSLNTIISFCKANWDYTIWSFKKVLPSL